MKSINGTTKVENTYKSTIYRIDQSFTVFGRKVTTFPEGIGEAFTQLSNDVPSGSTRDYYGISYCENNEIQYFVTTGELISGEAKRSKAEVFEIEAGEYLAVTLHEWQTKTDSIKGIFHDMMHDHRIDLAKPCIEWYKTDDEMICLIKLADGK